MDEYEAWTKSGVTHLRWGVNHEPGTKVDLFEFKNPLTPDEEIQLRAWLDLQVGKRYDWMGLLGFLPVFRLFGIRNNPNSWFCSEITSAGCIQVNRQLSRRKPCFMSPDDCVMSEIVRWVATWTVPDKRLGNLALA
jgi:hypothetical protein